ncbi:hypothetical protein D1007_31165 [Hordeum vulgare]|uniref:Predicted protein n=1 Tax=Hordeum vulgare subsp. vulgare TaxID=112509 RepID=F2EHN9_HORVV|nr:uncharacterized protein LOC123430112 [Hordeum vulgare subsp. vulgare]KAE8794104.1 hypothetical protein D1007_31165 [Hordeum vulgare]KAI5012663.1 hypothetical protein ZWY2020_024929 [Hordeum vulgare]BAK06861.1 predicted protein [Hordeum vulgare subsp. vulgare]
MAIATPRSSLIIMFVLLVSSASLVVDGGSIVKETCAKTPQPSYCEQLLKSSSASDARALAQAGVAAASKAATEAATAAKAERDKLPNNKTQWRCMDSCASGFDEATNKFKPAAGGNATGVDAGLTDVLDFIVVDEDVEKSKDWEWKWSCNECKADPTAPAGLVAKNKEFDKIMEVLPAIIKQAVEGKDNSTKSATKS